MDDDACMRLAIDKAREGIARGQSPFGACIAAAGRPVAVCHNVVLETTDITAHAEVHALRIACGRLQSIDLSSCAIYSTCEPCPMCFSAIHWARIPRIVFGASIADAKAAGFHELEIRTDQMKQIGHSPIAVESGFLAAECAALFAAWLADPAHRAY